jgi:hypothetical protein
MGKSDRLYTTQYAGYRPFHCGFLFSLKAVTHIQSSPFAKEDDTNEIERFQGTIKDRTKVLPGFKTVDTAIIIIDGFLAHYNFFKPHMSLKDFPPKGIDKTPADVAGIKLPFKTWTEFVRQDK